MEKPASRYLSCRFSGLIALAKKGDIFLEEQERGSNFFLQ
jgi:hypothetical protein